MNSVLARLGDSLSTRIVPAALWLGVAAVLGAALHLVVRSCGYQYLEVAHYGSYFLLHVLLPGVVVLSLAQGGRLSWLNVIALGLPTGFALEMIGFLGFSALGLKSLFAALPTFWGAAFVAILVKRGQWPVRCQIGMRHAVAALVLSVIFLGTVVSAVSQMYSESPLVDGWPQRPIFHDWIYLVSRAAAIKQHWPIEDPSMAGTPLQYHYFMMVHAAAASWTTGVELTFVLLRLMIVPMGIVLVAQAFVLGRYLSRRVSGGLLAAGLTICASGLSFRSDYHQPQFLDLFSRWLYVSPTFYFGMIYFGALLLAVLKCDHAPALRPRLVLWVALLTAMGTGAKGTILPVLLFALGLWIGWRWLSERKFPARLTVIAFTMGLAFTLVYLATMSAWGAGTAKLVPFSAYPLTQFWQEYLVPVTRPLKRWLHAPDFGTWLGACSVAFGVLAGTLGVRLLALAYLTRKHTGHRPRTGGWLGAALVSSCVLGSAIQFDSHGELYLLLLMRLPAAVLAAAYIVSACARLRAWWRENQPEVAAGTATRLRLRWPPRTWIQASVVSVAVTGLALTLLVQCSVWVSRTRGGFAEWLRAKPGLQINGDLVPLYDAMRWLRQNTPADAVVVANAFTPKNLGAGRGVPVDHTTVGVHYYYSALSERRLWVEGPSYALDQQRARSRMQVADRIFYGSHSPTALLGAESPCYLLLDQSIGDGAAVPLAERHRLFANSRYQIYRLPQHYVLSRRHVAANANAD